MFANGYVGSSEDAQKLRKLGKQREQQRKKFEELQEKKKGEAAGLRQFGASKSEVLEAAFKNETVGLVTRQEFLEKRATIQDRLAEDELRERLEAETAAHAEKDRRRKEKEKKKAKSKLSFAADVSCGWLSSSGTGACPHLLPAEGRTCSSALSSERNVCVVLTRLLPYLPQEEGEEQPEAVQQQPQPNQQPEAAAKRVASSGDDELPSTSGTAADGPGPPLKRPKFSKLGKDPGVVTNFLPDTDRELQEEELRQQLKKVSSTETHSDTCCYSHCSWIGADAHGNRLLSQQLAVCVLSAAGPAAPASEVRHVLMYFEDHKMRSSG